MNDRLHPMTLSEILDRTAQLYRSRFFVFFGIGVIPAGTVLVSAATLFAVLAWIGSAGAASSVPSMVLASMTFLFGSLVALPACLGTTALGAAAMSDAAARLFLGEKISIFESYKTAWKRGWRYLGLYVLKALIIAGAPTVVGFVFLIFVSVGSALLARQLGAGGQLLLGVFMFLFFVLVVSYVIWMLLRLCLSFPVTVVEQLSATDSLKRASMLSGGTRGRIFVLYLLGMVLGWVLAVGVAVPAFIGLALIPSLKGPQHSETLGMAMMFVSYGSTFAVQAFTKPVYAIALTLFYFDQRIRKEGFDIEWMMHQAGMVAPPAPEPETIPWLPSAQSPDMAAAVHPVNPSVRSEIIVETAIAPNPLQQADEAIATQPTSGEKR
jgi:hypothetical protein